VIEQFAVKYPAIPRFHKRKWTRL